MPISPKYSYTKWTVEAVFAEALKYKNRAEFKRSCAGAYEFALSNGYLDQCCSHMRDGQRFWHVFELMAVAIKYTVKRDFIKAERQAYEFMKKNGLIDVICEHMDKPRAWDKPSVMAEAAKYSAKGMFHACAAGAYKHADRHGYMDEACAHMDAPVYGFSKEKSATLYFLRITAPDGFTVYKVGITNRAVEARIMGMGAFEGVRIEIVETIVFPNGRDARIAEKRLHRKFSSHRYDGPPLMKNGNSELFTVNVLDD